MTTPGCEADEAYWVERFVDEVPALDLPLDRQRPVRFSGAAARVDHVLDAELTRAIRAIGTTLGASVFASLLAAFAGFLTRVSGQRRVVVGVPVQRGDGTITLPLLFESDVGKPFRDAIDTAQIVLLDGLGHTRFSSDALLRRLSIGTDPSRMPLVSVLFNLDRGLGSGDPAAGLSPVQVDELRAAGSFELFINAVPVQGGLRLECQYSRDLFEEGTVRRWLSAYEAMLRSLCRAPEQALGDADILSAEDAKCLETWNTTAVSLPAETTLHAMLTAQAERTPDRAAIRFAGKTTSFAELHHRSDAIAAAILRRGVTPGQLVGVFLERHPDLVAAMIGVLKAGAAYVPMDPAYPTERLRFMAEDGDLALILSEGSLADELHWPREKLLRIDADSDEIARPQGQAHEPRPLLAGPDSPAYVIFTSGSTGRPKGVCVPHRAVVNFLASMRKVPGLHPDDRLLAVTTTSFDIAVLELFLPLTTGAEIVLAARDQAIAGDELARLIRECDVTVMQATPSTWRLLLEAGFEGSRRFKALCGGEGFPPDLAIQLHAICGEVWNMYGPTETTVWSTCARVRVEDGVPDLTIGTPIDNTTVWALDPRGQRCPIGVPGELFIGGDGVTLGYLRRDDLTRERFLPDPFLPRGSGDQPKMYRTGDRGRWRADGTLEHLGRLDFQVKVRGYRIELGEIETVLLSHPSVARSVVVTHEAKPGDLRLVAYVVSAPAARADVPALLDHVRAALPHYMVPQHLLVLDAIPLLPNGKVDRRSLPPPDSARPELAATYEPPASDDEKAVCDAFSAVLDVSPIGRNDNFFDVGGNSLLAMRLLERVRRIFRERGAADIAPLSATSFFRHPTPAALTKTLSGKGGTGATLDASRFGKSRGAAMRSEPIAIVAMAGRFPGADDVETFWKNLLDGKDTITKFDRADLDPSISDADRNDPAYVPARGIIEGLELFDAGFFGFSPREAELMDPQQRILLELSWECLERAGYAPDTIPVPVGVFAGMNNATYFQNHVSRRPDLIEKLGAFQVMVNNEKDYVAMRVSHKLNLTGPALSTHTACSTSLVTICQAVDSLRLGQCDMAIAGATSATCPPKSGYRYIEGAMFSPDGHTRTFDEDSRGTVFSDGAAIVLLKRLSDALADGDEVIAVIKGAAINNDGGQKASFTAPNAEGQAAVIAMAHADAGVDPRSISYVEAHGTATPLGDPIEIEGLTQAFRARTQDTGFCRIGSVKSNVGHLVMAAGAAGVIKTALALRDEIIPETVHFKAPNPTIDFASTPFVITPGPSEWRRAPGAPRRAGVSSFGVGGTNAHIVMEEAPPQPISDPAVGPQILVLSARSPAVLERMAKNLGEHLAANPSINLADVAMTLDVGRKAFPHRFAVAVDTTESAAAILRSPDTAAAIARTRPAFASEVVFMFPGQGSQYAGMGRELYATEAHFRQAFDECADGLKSELGFDLRDVVFHGEAEALLPTSVMQPALFSVQYALARLWMSYGVMPAAMMGHSIGEFAAAALAGVFSLTDALKLVARRGRLMQEQPAGSMLSVRMPLAELTPRVPAALSIAAENAPTACVVSGPTDDVKELQATLEAEGIACRLLFTSHAFHSAMMDPVVDAFRAEVAAVKRAAPQMPILSTATAAFLDEATATSPDYWANHLRQPVRFSAAIRESIALPARVLLEVGSRTTLTALARQHPELGKAQKTALSSLAGSPEGEVRDFRQAAGQLWSSGVSIDLALFDARAVRRRVRLPTYAFERQRHWIEATAPAIETAPAKNVPSAKTATNGANGAHKPVAAARPSSDRRGALVARLRATFEDAAGLEISDPTMNFIEVGLDSLMLTQIALRLGKSFGVKVTFRQLLRDCSNLERLAEKIEAELPEAAPLDASDVAPPTPHAAPEKATAAAPDLLQRVLELQLQMAAQIQLLVQGQGGGDVARLLREQESTAKAILAEAKAPPPRPADPRLMDASRPIHPGARLGRAPNGEPAWYVPDPKQPGRFMKVAG